MTDINYTYQLDDCLDWILDHGFKRVVIQLKREDLKHSVNILNYLGEKNHERSTESNLSLEIKDAESIDFYVTQSNTCCVDMLVTQHVSNLDAIIHIGKVCLSKPEIKNLEVQQPILFVFGRIPILEDKFSRNIELIMHEIESLKLSDANCRICLLYDTCLIEYASKLANIITKKGYDSHINVANLYCPASTWHTTPENRSRFIKNRDQDTSLFGHHLLEKPISYYNYAIYLGNGPSIPLALEGPNEILKINCYDRMDIEKVNVSKLLNKRIALISRLKEEIELKIGVIITNPLPDITSIMDRLETYSKPRKHTLYFISMIQTIDECKIGNFDLCDAFIVINSCTCSTILESLVFNRPIIIELEYKLACGFEAEYGRVKWPGSSCHLTEDDMINKRRVSDTALALVHMRNELLERCSQARADKWSGLEYKASDGISGGDGHKSLGVEEGLKGIASCYVSEPLKKLDSVEENVASGSATTAAAIADFDVGNN